MADVMTQAFDAYAPLFEPKPVCENVWLVDGPEIRMDFALGMSIPFPTRNGCRPPG